MAREKLAATPAWWEPSGWIAYLKECSYEVGLVVPNGWEPWVDAWVNALASFCPTKQDGVRFVIVRRAVKRAGRDEAFNDALCSACDLGGHVAVHALLLDLHKTGRLR